MDGLHPDPSADPKASGSAAGGSPQPSILSRNCPWLHRVTLPKVMPFSQGSLYPITSLRGYGNSEGSFRYQSSPRGSAEAFVEAIAQSNFSQSFLSLYLGMFIPRAPLISFLNANLHLRLGFPGNQPVPVATRNSSRRRHQDRILQLNRLLSDQQCRPPTSWGEFSLRTGSSAIVKTSAGSEFG